MNPKLDTNSPFFNVLLFSLFWALQLFVSKLGFIRGTPVLPFQVIASLVAFLALIIAFLSSTKAEFKHLTRQRPDILWKLFLIDSLHYGLGTGISIVGVALTDAINAGFLVKLATVTTIFFAWWLLGERITWLKLIAVPSMLAGAYLLTTKGQSLLPYAGDIYLLIACVCWSLGNILLRRVLRAEPVSADVVSIIRPVAGMPVFILLGTLAQIIPLPTELHATIGTFIIPSDLLIFPIIAGLLFAVTWVYLNRTLKVATSSYLSMMSMLTPVFVTLLAVTFLGERMVLIQVIGAMMIVLSGVATYFSDTAYS